MNSPACNQFWGFREVPKLVGKLLSEAFGGHTFKVRRNSSKEAISISWDIGPTHDEVDSFIRETFPRVTYDNNWGRRLDAQPRRIEGRMLHSYRYTTRRRDLFNAGAKDIPRLIAAGADIGERDDRGYIPIEQAVMRGDESAAIALLDAGSDYYNLLPGGDLCESQLIMPVLWAAVESRELAIDMTDNDQQVVQRRRL